MSDLSGLDRSFGLAGVGMVPPLLEELPASVTRLPSADVQPDEVGFRELQGVHEVARILHLRREIPLPASAVGDAGFALREKKETRSGSWGRSCVRGSTSEPCASFR
jgi:hypothetical protein